MAQHTRTGQPRYRARAEWWRTEIATAATPAEQYRQVQRYLHARGRRASPQARDRAFTDTVRAITEICERLEIQTAPGPTWLDER